MSGATGFGIDFGTTNSLIAVCAPGERQPITCLTDPDGRPHPSVVWYRVGSEAVVGRQARLNINAWSDVTGNAFVPSIKRHLGHDVELDILGERKDAWNVASDILTYLLADARKRGKEVREAVITVPVRFDGRARRELRRAADQAGLHINTFVHEPFAAVVGHLYKQHGRPTLAEWIGKTVLVFDWGGGTLDITVARVTDAGIVELATRGLADRSGDYFDDLLLRYSQRQIAEKKRLAADGIKIDRSRRDKLLYECESAKMTLSQDMHANLQLQGAFRAGAHAVDVDMIITREQFEQEIMPTVDAARELVEETLDAAGLTPRQIDEALLIGGTSRIPFVRQHLHDLFGARITYVTNADSIIAEGASIVAAHGMQPFLARTIAISLSDGAHFPVFPAGRPAIPDACSESLNLFCTDPRDGFAHLVVEESVAYGDNTHYQTKQTLPIPVSADLPKNYRPERVTAHFALDQDLILHVTGNGATQGEGRSMEIEDLCFGLTHGAD